MSDFDGDLCCTTDNKTFFERKQFQGVPITYKKNAIKKGTINPKDFYKADIDSFNATIGQITNYSTSDYDLINKYRTHIREFFGENNMKVCREMFEERKNISTNWSAEFKKIIEDFKCYDELIERLKLTRRAQGDSIDRAKGLKVDPYPSHWIHRQSYVETDTPQLTVQKEFLNEICGDRKPYFFIYRYPQLKADYDAYIAKKEQMSMFLFGKDLVELITGKKSEDTNVRQINFLILDEIKWDEKTEEEQKFIKDFFDFMPVIDYNSPMNKICRHMEKELSVINRIKTGKTPESVISLLRTSKNVSDDEIAVFDSYCKRFFKAKKEYKINGSCKNVAENEREMEAASFDQYKRLLKEEVIAYFVSSEKIANIAVEYAYVRNKRNSKSFVWELFGRFLVDNIIANTRELKEKSSVILSDPTGEINYLHNHYKEIEVEL